MIIRNTKGMSGRKKGETLKALSFSALLILIFLFNLNLISSAPPVTTTQNFETGYIIEDSPQQILKQNLFQLLALLQVLPILLIVIL
jgi:hypothetical protein